MWMPRPEKNRMVDSPPLIHDFKPSGIPKRFLGAVELSLDEYEAIKLSDYLGKDHAAGAEKMGVSRPTFTRLLERARKKMARFLIEGLHLQIEGGSVHFKRNILQCSSCRKLINTGISGSIRRCPFCGSSGIIDLASGFGHGSCCRHA